MIKKGHGRGNRSSGRWLGFVDRPSINQPVKRFEKDHNIYYNVILATFAATLLFNYKLALKTFKWEPLINYFFLNVLPSIYLIYYLFFFKKVSLSNT